MSDDDDALNKPQKKALGLIRLIELLRRKPRFLDELKEALGLEERAVYNYLDDLEQLGHPELLNFHLDRSYGKYYIEPKNRLVLSTVDALVSHAALRMMAHHSPGDGRFYREALLKLAENLPSDLRNIAIQSTYELEQRSDNPGARNLGNSSNLERITEAWLGRNPVVFNYKLPNDRIIRVEIEVYLVEVSRANMAVYLIGRDTLYANAIHYLDNLKAYKLDRITGAVSVKDSTYTIPEDFEPHEYLSSAWGIVTGPNPITVKLKFSPAAAYRIKEGGYPNFKKVEQLEDGHILVEIETGTDDQGFPLELLPWIQSWGPRVEVLEPQNLRQTWLAEARALVAQHGGINQFTVKQYWAHTHQDRSKWQTMLEHTTEVARLASERADYFGERAKANLAGLLHDIGKYGDLFQRRLEGKESGLDHWSAGAHIALFEYRAIEIALAIQGHHIGLQSGAKQSLLEMKLEELQKKHPLELRLTETNVDLLKQRLEADVGSLPAPTQPIPKTLSAAEMLDTRMLFSALVDADFLDTERTMNQGNARFIPRPVAPKLQASRALELLEARLEQLGNDESIPQKTRELRRSLADDCANAANNPARIFTLTAPTGTGKTLSMLRFALRRAAQDPEVRRIVVVLPFLSILDQTVNVYRQLFAEFGEHYILEHHSLTGIRDKNSTSDQQSILERQKRLLTENWDAPIVITTSVQLLESLHASRPGACRKLHNLAGSIILFDEVQTLPVKLAVPTLKTLSGLTNEKYNCTVLFSTATQPAFDTLHTSIQQGEPIDSGWQPSEIVAQQAQLFSQAQRVNSVWKTQNALTWPHLVAELQDQPQALCIVNLKRHAYALTQEAQKQRLEGIYHLSTALCPQHRRDLLAQIVADLKAKKPCRVFATQCVEAGVDLDFPNVYRALAPLDAIAQAAGRCNRHDSLPERGTLTVFLPEEEKYPTRAYQQAAQLTRSQLVEHDGLNLDDPETYRRFYKSLYNIADTTDQELENFIKTQNYEEFAKRYRLIETHAVNVVVPYNLEAKTLMQEARDSGITGDWMRRVRGYTVPHFLAVDGVPPYLETLFLRYQWGSRTEVSDWFLCGEESRYDSLLGFLPEEGGVFGALVV
ncbi:MAG: CRISPR-associated helicase Cas3' [Thermaceae bacterium]|nr:CRISPR-associated helicase Cas3' [Thermaceae bacterium]